MYVYVLILHIYVLMRHDYHVCYIDLVMSMAPAAWGGKSQLSLHGIRDSHIPLEGFPEGNPGLGRLVYKGGCAPGS